jgi:superfamily II DNA/RNA helicase
MPLTIAPFKKHGCNIRRHPFKGMCNSMTFSKETKNESQDSKHAGSIFQSFALAAPLLKNVAELGFTQATPVQSQVIPAALAGGDLLVSSQTGSGKTAAFLLPLINQLIDDNPNNSPVPGRAQPKVLVLCPTRELAQQVAADAVNLVRGMKGIRIATVMGGMPYGKQIQALKGALLVVATPGRLLDLCDSKAIRLDDVKQLVIDEADRMLDMGFADDLEAIDKRCAGRKQTLMFSATFAPKIMSLANALTTDAKRIELAHAGEKHANIEQKLHWADSMSHKHKLLEHILADATLDQAVVFASTQVESEKIADTLRANGYEASALHGAMPQAVRMRRLESLRKGHTKILVATDVAARGIDVPRISHVINFGLPMKPEDYTHRIGRTGRAGRNGVAITLVEHRDRAKIRNIERFTQQDIVASVIAGLEPQAKPSFGGGGGRPGGRSGGGGGGNRSGGGGGRYGSGARSESRFGGGGGGSSGGRSSDSRPARSDDSRPARSADSRPARSADSRPAGPRFAKPKSGGQRRNFSGS